MYGSKHSVVYFVLAPEVQRVKIGTTDSLCNRLQMLRAFSPCTLTILGTIPGGRKTELHWHKKWISARDHNEWFDYTLELEREILETATPVLEPETLAVLSTGRNPQQSFPQPFPRH